MAQTTVSGRQRSLLCLLPQEIVITIARFATLGTHNNLSRTCQYLTSILQPELFRRSNTDDNHYTALVYGCQNMDSNMVIGRALSYGIPPGVDHGLPNGDTALCVAAFHGCTTAVEYLLSRGANPDLTGAGDITPLGHGLRGCANLRPLEVEPEEVEQVRSRGQQYVEVMLRLLDNGANPHFNLPRDIGIDFDHDQSTPNAVSAVLDAVLNRYKTLTDVQGEPLIRKLVLKGVSPDVFNIDEVSPLSWAVLRYCQGTGSFDLIEFLLDHGADIRYGFDGRYPQLTALGVAISQKRADVVRYLLSRGAYPEFTRGDEQSLLWYAIKSRSDEKTISVLLQAKADPNYVGWAEDPDDVPFRFCRTPLGAAVVDFSMLKRPEKVMSMLLGHGANPNERDIHGRTPLGEALAMEIIGTTSDRRNIVYLLLYSGADPNLVDPQGVKPLTAAVYCQDWDKCYTPESERLDIIDMLVKAGADPMKGNDAPKGLSPLELALTGDGDPSMNFQDRLDDLKNVEDLHTRRLTQLGNELPADGGVSCSVSMRISLRPVLYADFGPKWRNKLIPRLLMAGAEVSRTDILEMRAAIESEQTFTEADEEEADEEEADEEEADEEEADEEEA